MATNRLSLTTLKKMYIVIQCFKVPREFSKLQYAHLGCFSPNTMSKTEILTMATSISLDTRKRSKGFLREGALHLCVYMLFLRRVLTETRTGLTQQLLFLEEDELRKFILCIRLEKIDSLFIFRLEK